MTRRSHTNQMKMPQRRSTAPLPMPVTSRGLPELREESARFAADLEALARVLSYSCGEMPTDAEVALVRRIASDIDLQRVRWGCLNEPADDEQIAGEMLRLTTTMATAGNLNPNLLNETLCEVIEELKPTFFALVRGCNAVRKKHEFLNISNVVEAIEIAERAAHRFSYALKRFNPTEFEDDLQSQI